MNNIDYTEYDRITDTLMWLSDNISLNFTVGLSRKTKTGERAFYHYETKYGSDKYGTPLRSIKRQISYAFTIDCKDDFLAGMMLRPQDVELIVRIIDKKVFPWYFGDNKQLAFKVIDDKLVLKEFTPVPFVQDSKWLSFQPAIYVDPYTELESRGIRMELYSGYSWIMPIDKFMGFFHIISTSDMYGIACNMCNYVKMQPYGVNVYSNQGLGASPNGSNSTVDEAWKNITMNMNNNNQGFGSNAFLNNSNSRKKGE